MCPPLVEKMLNFEYTLSQARCAHVFKSGATREFLEARRGWDSWILYNERCQMRHEWGIYLRSNLDWDWDVAGCLEGLFELPENVTSPTATIATVSLDVRNVDTWNISTESSLPRKMKVTYKSGTGEMKYKTFVSCPSSEDVVSTGE